MLRTSELRGKRLQEIISKEIIHGFDMVFGINTGRSDIMDMMFDEFCYYMDLKFVTDLEKQLLRIKIQGMYDELKDPNHYYTFDEHGEWLLFKALMKANEEIKEGFAMWDDLELRENRDPFFDDFWESSLTAEEKRYVRSFATDYFEKEKEEMFYEMEIDDETEQKALLKECIDSLVERISYFPKMLKEVTEDAVPAFLFWDTDFLFVDSLGLDGFNALAELLKAKGFDYGFSKVDENTQMLTGSAQFGLDDE